MNRRKILAIVIITATIAGSTLGTVNFLKNSKDKALVEINETLDKKEIKKDELLEVNTDNENQLLEDGEFLGEGKGYGGIIKVKVTVKDAKIHNIEVLAHSETPSFFKKAEIVLERIINKNSPDVDSVSGATLTSNGFKEAVSNALKNHGLNDISKKNTEKSEKNQRVEKNKLNLNIIDIKEKALKDGEYLGSAKGFRGNIKVKAIIKNGEIKEIKLLSHNDDEEFMNKAKRVIDSVLNKQAISGVDTVSGATYSSKGILEAISNAISKATISNKKNSIVEKANLDLKNNKVRVDNNATNLITKFNSKIINSNIKDGEYFGTAKGFKDNIKVKAIVKNGKIYDVELVNHNDDEEFMNKAKRVIDSVLKKQTIREVDTVSGATYSSRGILEAINNAISKGIIHNENTVEEGNSYKKIANNIIEFINTKTNKLMDVINTNKTNIEGNDKVTDENINIKSDVKLNIEGFKDGEYFGTAEGFRGDLKVKTTIKDGKISDIDIIENEEDEAYLNSAKELIPKILINQNTNNIDTISGATYSSNAILNAVKNSLEEMNLNNEKHVKKDDDKVVKDENKVDENKTLTNRVFEGKAPAYYPDKYTITNVTLNKDNKIDNISIVKYADDGGRYKRKAMTAIDYIIKNPKKTAEDLNEFIEIFEKINSTSDYTVKKEVAKKLIGKYADEIIYNDNEDIGKKILKLKECIKKYMKSLNRGEVLDSVSGATYSAAGIANSVKNAIDKSELKIHSNIKNIKMKNKKVIINVNNNKNVDLSNLIVEIEYNDGTKKDVPYNKFKENNIKIYNVETKKEIPEDKLNNKNGLIAEVIQLDSLQRDSFNLYVENISDNKLIEMEYSLDNGASWSKIKEVQFYPNNIRGGNLNSKQTIELPNKDLEKNIKGRIRSKNGEVYELENVNVNSKETITFNTLKKDRDANGNLEYMYSIIILNDKYNKLYAKNITLNQGELFNPKDYIKAESNDKKDLRDLVNITENTVDRNTPGEYKVTYTLGNIIKTIKVTVLEAKANINAVDKTIFVGDEFDPKLNVTAMSKNGKDLTSKIIINNLVKTNKPGKYSVWYFVRDEDDNKTKKIINVTVKERPSKLNDGIFIGKDYGLYEDKFILTKVKVEEGKLKGIDVSNEKSTYGDDIIPYRAKAILIVDEILKDKDKTINDLIEYDNILKALSTAALKNYNSQDLVNEGKKLIGDYSKDFKKIQIKKAYGKKDIEIKVANKVKEYLKSKNKGQALDTVSGATYSAVGITKSVKNAIDKSKVDSNIQEVIIKGIENDLYTVKAFDDELESKKLDLNKISVDIYYNNGTIKNIPFNKFEENKIELINCKTNKTIDFNLPLKAFEKETKVKLLNKESLTEKTFDLKINTVSRDFIKIFEYSLDYGKSWVEIKNPNIMKDNLTYYQNFIVDDKVINKKIIARVKSHKNNIYYLNSETAEALIEQGKISISFNANKEDIKNNNNIETIYRLDFQYKLSENLKPIIEAQDKTIIQGEKFNPLDGIKATNKKGDNLSRHLIVTKNEVNPIEPGTYKVTYYIDGIYKSINVTVKKIETDKKLELLVSDKSIKKGESFDPKEGVKATSKTGQDLTDKVIFSSKVDVNKVGEYKIIYLIRDLDDEVIRKNIKVTVTE